MIDLHLHTIASDGSLPPRDLVARAAAAGITTLSVTDHDTIAGLADARDAAATRGLVFVDGIEITAVERGRDVHVLGYFFDPYSQELAAFLERQRADRRRRVVEIVGRLCAHGCAIDAEPLLAAGCAPGKSIGRPQIADALIATGYARDRDDAFERFLGDDCPAYVPRKGGTPEDVVAIIGRAGGIASLAHPGLLGDDALVARLARAGLAALEVVHSEHDLATERHYRHMARALNLAVSGGSDFHGDSGRRAAAIGVVTLPPADFAQLEARRG